MRPGPRIKTPDVQIPYKELRKFNPEAARRAVLEYLRAGGHSVAETARLFDIVLPGMDGEAIDIVPRSRISSIAERRHRLAAHAPGHTPGAKKQVPIMPNDNQRP